MGVCHGSSSYTRVAQAFSLCVTICLSQRDDSGIASRDADFDLAVVDGHRQIPPDIFRRLKGQRDVYGGLLSRRVHRPKIVAPSPRMQPRLHAFVVSSYPRFDETRKEGLAARRMM